MNISESPLDEDCHVMASLAQLALQSSRGCFGVTHSDTGVWTAL